MRFWALAVVVASMLWIAGCGGGTVVTPPPVVSVKVTPPTATLRGGDTQQFSGFAVNTPNSAVTWSVAGIPGGSASVGTIDATGLYTAPIPAPTTNVVQVTATSVADPTTSQSATTTLLNPIAQVYLFTPATLTPNTAFNLTVTGNKFVSGAQVMFGATPATTSFVDSSHLTVTGTSPAAGVVAVTVVNPTPDGAPSVARSLAVGAVSQRAAVRFLEQSTFGPTASQLVAVEAGGMEQFLLSQFDPSQAPPSQYPTPDPTQNVLFAEQAAFFQNAMNPQANSDQLRQRIVFALNQLWVVSGNKVGQPRFFTPYEQTLANDSFTNYRQIMGDVTLTPAMGLYLDMVDNAKPDPVAGTHANENYAREFLQLFTIGPNKLNPDGTPVLQSGNLVPTYTQADIQNMARVFTGWTFSDPALNCANWPYGDYSNPQAGSPMVPCDSNHDVAAKTILGNALPANQTSQQDLDGALNIVFNHPNLPPFVAQRFIRNMVTSNPSPAYVTRVATAFANGTFTSNGITFNGGTGRGDMQALIAAILLDPEARRGDSSATENPLDGHLREPTLLLTNILRALNGTSDGQNLQYIAGSVGQQVFYSASVFNFYPPLAGVPLTQPPLLGPEFALYNTASSLNRVNLIEQAIFSSLTPTTQIDLSAITGLANDPQTMVEALNQQLLHGTMSAPMRTAVLNAVNAVPPGNPLAEAQTAAYLIMSSSQYQVQR